MSLALFVYFASIIQGIHALIYTFAIFCLVYSAFISISGYEFKLHKPGVILAALLFFVSAIIPSEKAMYTIAGAYLVQSAYQSETGDKIVRLINSKIDEQLSKIEKMQPAVPAK